jgi:adenylate kinase family enzyme
MIDYKKEIEKAKAKLLDKKLNLIVLGPSGSGKSSLCGTVGEPTLFLYLSTEMHGPEAASTFATGEVTPICLDDGRTPDEAYAFLNQILQDKAFLKPFGVVVLDSATSLELLIRETSEFNMRCLTDKGKRNSFAEHTVSVVLLTDIIRKMQATGKHTIMTCALDVKEYDEETGEIVEAHPQLSGYKVAENCIMAHSEVCMIGPMHKEDKTAHRIQFGGKITKTSKDGAGKVKRLFNFTPRVTGVKVLPASLPASLSELIKLKEGKK